MTLAVGQDPNWVPYVGSAVFLVGMAWAAMRWTRRTVQKDLDPANSGRMRASMAMKADVVPPALVKEALAKGLVSSAQLATMSPIERQFLFSQLAPKLAAAREGAAPAPMTSTNLPLKPSEPTAPVDAPQLRSTQAIPIIPGKPMSLPPLTPAQIAALGPPGRAGAPGAVPAPASAPRTSAPSPAATPSAAKAPDALAGALSDESQALRVFCPCCGALLTMPAFPPHVAFCDHCGAKTAVRTEEQGRLMINTAPPGVTRRPVR